MTTDTTALLAALKLICDFANDSVDLQADGSSIKVMIAYDDLLPDFLTLLPNLGDIPLEAKALKPVDYETLVAYMTQNLKVLDGHENVVDASLAVLNEVLSGLVPKVQALALLIRPKT